MKIKNKFSAFYCVLLIFLVLYVASFVFLFGWGVLTTFKEQYGAHGYRVNKIGLPNPWVFTNYKDAFLNLTVEINSLAYRMWEMYFNAILYSVGSALCNTLVSCLVAYLIARYNYVFSKCIYVFVVVTISLPIVGSTPSAIQIAKMFGVYDNMIGMWIMSANFLSGVYFLIFYETFKGVPNGFKEAAEIDGASQFRIMVSIIFPLVKNIFFTIFLIKMIGYWNDYQSPLLYMPHSPTIAYGLFVFFFQSNNVYSTIPMKITGAILVATPIIVVFIIFQKRIMGNLTAGGLKE